MENKIKFTAFDEGLVIKISGELDSMKTMTYRDKIHREMIKLGPRMLLFDFKDLQFIDSSGIGLILGRFNEIDKIGGVVGITGLNDYSRKIFQITGILQIIEEYQSTAQFKKKARINL